VDARVCRSWGNRVLEPQQGPAPELAALYHERWEIEAALDELTTHLRGANIVLRSKTPDLVRQEFYGLLMAHFAVRALMHEAALSAGVDPDRLSFIHAVRVVRRKLSAFSTIPPVQRKAFHERVLQEILQERVACRRGRRNRRGVKRKMSNWPICRSRSAPLQPVIISEAIRIVKWCIASSPIGTSVGSYLFDSEVELAWSAGRELPGNDSLFCFAFSKNCNKLCGKVMCHDIVITNYT
jgi:hypothetical protein